MPSTLEQIYNAQNEDAFPIQPVNFDTVPAEELSRLEAIARRVGGDFGMKIRVGRVGSGSFFNPMDCSITFDPVHLKENPSFARFVAGHEGSHRAITPGPDKIGLSKKDTQSLYSQVGFGYLQNAIEDPAVNDWMMKRFPGLAEDTKQMYDSQFAKENAAMITPEIEQIAQQIGFMPKFAQFGSEIIRDWHQGRFSNELDPAVREALDKTINHARKSWSTIPNPLKRKKSEIISKAQERFKINTANVWPEMKKLVDMDIKTGAANQALQELLEKEQQLDNKREELEKAKEQGETEKAEQIQKEIEQLESEKKEASNLDEKVMEEIKKAIEKAIEKAKEKLKKSISDKTDKASEKQKEIDKIKKEIEEAEKSDQDGEEASGEGEKPGGSEKSGGQPGEGDPEGSGEESDEDGFSAPGGKKGGKKQGKKLSDKRRQLEAAQKQKDDLEKEIKDEEEKLRGVTGGKKTIPVPELSEETKKAIEDFYDKEISEEEKKEFEEKAKEELKKIEEKLNEELSSKLDPNRQSTNEKELRDRTAGTSIPNVAPFDQEKLREFFGRFRKSETTDYEKFRVEMSNLIDDLYRRLRRILKPEDSGEEDSGYSSGVYPDFSRIMQTERDINQKQKIWVREETPATKDFRFWHLVDVSGSMQGKRIAETLKGLVVVGEALDKVENLNSINMTIRQGITAFHNRVFPIKKTTERLGKDITDKITRLPDMTYDDGNGTNTFLATETVLKDMTKDLATGANFLFVFSDGEPNSDISRDLSILLKEGKEKRHKQKIRVGLIWIGDQIDEETIENLKKRYPYDFVLSMPAVLPDQGSGGKNFAETFGDMMEDIVNNPEKY